MIIDLGPVAGFGKTEYNLRPHPSKLESELLEEDVN